MNAKRFFFVILSVLLLTVIGSGWLYLQTKQSLQTSINAIAGKKAEIEQAETKVSDLQALRAEIAAYEEQDVNLSVLLPTAKNQSEALDILMGIFNKVGVNIESFNFTPTQGVPNSTSQSDRDTATNVYDLPIAVAPNSETSISYRTFMQLLVELENSQRHLSIDSLVVQTRDEEDGGGGGGLDVSLSISMHYVE